MVGSVTAVWSKPVGQRPVNDMSCPSSLQFLEDADCQYRWSIRGVHVIFFRIEDSEDLVLPFGVGIIFLILAHPVYKMWIIQEPNMLELWNKLHFEEEKTEIIHHV